MEEITNNTTCLNSLCYVERHVKSGNTQDKIVDMDFVKSVKNIIEDCEIPIFKPLIKTYTNIDQIENVELRERVSRICDYVVGLQFSRMNAGFNHIDGLNTGESSDTEEKE